MRFAINIAMLFNELPFLDRIRAAGEAGFDAVEFWWPSKQDRGRVVAVCEEAGVRPIRFAIDPGPPEAGGMGTLCDPSRVAHFRESALDALELAAEAGCEMINAPVGRRDERYGRSTQWACGRDNLIWLAEQAGDSGPRVLIEANCAQEKPGYLITTTPGAHALVTEVNRPNVSLLFDAFHMQRSEGDLTHTFATYLPSIAHVQIGDAPDRHEPGTGEISFPNLLRSFHDLGYRGYVGLEYRPATNTWDGLDWLPRDLRSGPVDRDALTAAGR